MEALSVLPQHQPVDSVRSGRKQPQQETCVPGCSWQGLHQFPLCIHSLVKNLKNLKLILLTGLYAIADCLYGFNLYTYAAIVAPLTYSAIWFFSLPDSNEFGYRRFTFAHSL